MASRHPKKVFIATLFYYSFIQLVTEREKSGPTFGGSLRASWQIRPELSMLGW